MLSYEESIEVWQNVVQSWIDEYSRLESIRMPPVINYPDLEKYKITEFEGVKVVKIKEKRENWQEVIEDG